MYKDEVEFPAPLPPLPAYPTLLASLQEPYVRLAGDQDGNRRPVHKVTEDQVKTAEREGEGEGVQSLGLRA